MLTESSGDEDCCNAFIDRADSERKGSVIVDEEEKVPSAAGDEIVYSSSTKYGSDEDTCSVDAGNEGVYNAPSDNGRKDDAGNGTSSFVVYKKDV